jgi:hypothetical protein
MSTVEVVDPRGAALLPRRPAAIGAPSRTPHALAIWLLLAVLYAAFDDGAVSLAVEARIQVAIALITLVAAGAFAEAVISPAFMDEIVLRRRQ